MSHSVRHSLIPIILYMMVACAPKTIPPELKGVYTANEVLLRVSELQKTTIGLYEKQIIKREYAEPIVMFTILAAEAIQNSPNGWKPTVIGLWKETKQLVPTPPNELGTIWELMDMVILTLG